MHALKDAELARSVALPAAGSSASTPSIDLVAATQAESHFEVLVSLPALPALVQDKAVTVVLEDSADGSAFAAIPELAPFEVVGGTGGGAAAASRRVRMPAAARRHLRATASVESGGGNSTAALLLVELVF